MSRSYLIRLSGETKNPEHISLIKYIVDGFILNSQIWKLEINRDFPKEFEIIFEAGASGGVGIKEIIDNLIISKLNNLSYLSEWKILVYDLHPDKMMYHFTDKGREK